MQWKMGVHTAHHIFSKHFVCTLSFNYCCLVKRKNANKLKHQTLPLMGATRLASGLFQQPRLGAFSAASSPLERNALAQQSPPHTSKLLVAEC